MRKEAIRKTMYLIHNSRKGGFSLKNTTCYSAPDIQHRLLCSGLPTPCYIIDEAKLIANGQILKNIQDETGCKILLAQKAFSNYDLYPALAPYLAGTEASGLFEARLGAEEMPEKECHVFCAAYREEDFEELLLYADHNVKNSN